MRETRIEGRPLGAWLTARIHAKRLTISEAAVHLEISQGYLSQLLKGDKGFSSVDESTLRAIAEFLQLPVIVVFLMAGKVRHGDFIDPGNSMDAKIERALEVIVQSPEAIEAAIDLDVLMAIPESVKLLLIFLYQKYAQVELIKPDRRWVWTKWINEESF